MSYGMSSSYNRPASAVNRPPNLLDRQSSGSSYDPTRPGGSSSFSSSLPSAPQYGASGSGSRLDPARPGTGYRCVLLPYPREHRSNASPLFYNFFPLTVRSTCRCCSQLANDDLDEPLRSCAAGHVAVRSGAPAAVDQQLGQPL